MGAVCVAGRKHVKASHGIGRNGQAERGSGEKASAPVLCFLACRQKQAIKQGKKGKKGPHVTPTTPKLAQLTDSSPAYGQFMPLGLLQLPIGSGGKAWRRHLSTLTFPH